VRDLQSLAQRKAAQFGADLKLTEIDVAVDKHG